MEAALKTQPDNATHSLKLQRRIAERSVPASFASLLCRLLLRDDDRKLGRGRLRVVERRSQMWRSQTQREDEAKKDRNRRSGMVVATIPLLLV